MEPSTFTFPGFDLDGERFELRVGGEPVKVEPRVLELLLYLAAHRRRVVPKQELLDAVWGGRFVSESALTRAVAEARRALGGGDPRQSPIRTVHGRGYQLVAPEAPEPVPPAAAAPVPPEPPPPPGVPPPGEGGGWLRGEARRGAASNARNLPWRAVLVLSFFAAAVAALAAGYQACRAEPPVRLALLPLAVAGPDDGELALAGLSLLDLLADRLGDLPGLALQRPEPRRGARAAPVFAAAPGPAFALGGTLRRSDEAGRARLELVLWEARPGREPRRTVLGRHDLPLLAGASDLAAFTRVRDAVARRLLARLLPAIDLAPDPGGSGRGPGRAPRDLEAYRLYLRALQPLREAACTGGTALELLAQSLERDPGFAPAWEELGWARYNLVSSCGESGENYRLAAAAARRALALDPCRPGAVALAAIVLAETGRAEEAFARLRRPRERAPGDLDLLFVESYVLTYAGFLGPAGERVERIAAADPTFFTAGGWTPNALLYRGERERYLALLPGSEEPLFRYYRGWAEAGLGRPERARRVLAPAFRHSPGDLFARLCQALLAILDQDPEEARILLRQLALQRARLGGSDGEVTYKTAQLLALAGDRREALAQLGLAVDQGFFCPACLADPAWAGLDAAPAFARLAARARERHLAFARRFGLAGEILRIPS